MLVLSDDLTCRRLQTQGSVERYVAGSLQEAEMAELEEHLLRCAECREEVRIAAGLREVFAESDSNVAIQRRRDPDWWVRAAVGSGLAAAVLAGVLFIGIDIGREAAPSRPPHRDRGASLQGEGVARFAIVQPRDEAVVPRDSLKFVWRVLAERAFYSFTLTDEAGDLVWRGTTRDSMLDLSMELRLKPGLYFWYVDARAPYASTASTGAHEFRVIR